VATALERAFMSSGRVAQFLFDMLERLEGRAHRSTEPTTAVPTPG